jgi:cell wall-associated NlpC family hydrolase
MRLRALAAAALVLGALAGCGQQGSSPPKPQSASKAAAQPGAAGSREAQSEIGAPASRAHPQAIEPVAGAGSGPSESSAPGPSVVSVGPLSGPLPQPVSDAEIRRELAASGLAARSNQATLTPRGLALSPVGAPAAVQQVIQAGNEIAHLPYIWGGGHARFVDTGYDCSGSLSFVFAAAGLLGTTMTSGELMNWGEPGPGKWITVFANRGHTFMYVAGLRFDTVALAQTGTRWSNRPGDEGNLSTFAVRHPPGL